MDSHKVEEIAADWMARRDGEQWSGAEEQALAHWRSESVAHEVAYLRVQSLWQQADRLRALGAGVPAGSIPSPGQWRVSPFFRSTHERKDPPRLVSRRTVSLAAGVLLAAAVAIAGYVLTHDPDAYQTRIGHIEAVPLVDGSQVTLNTDTRIQVAIAGAERRIDLKQGEVFFDVSKDPSRPFIVQVGQRRIVAVGTQFSVRRLANEIRVVVIEGRVRIDGDPTQLLAGSIATVGPIGVFVTQEPLSKAEDYLAWRSGYIVFNETPLTEAVAEFNRYNTRKLVIADSALADLNVGGTVRATNVKAFVRILEHAFAVQATEQGNRIHLTARP